MRRYEVEEKEGSRNKRDFGPAGPEPFRGNGGV